MAGVAKLLGAQPERQVDLGQLGFPLEVNNVADVVVCGDIPGA